MLLYGLISQKKNAVTLESIRRLVNFRKGGAAQIAIVVVDSRCFPSY